VERKVNPNFRRIAAASILLLVIGLLVACEREDIEPPPAPNHSLAVNKLGNGEGTVSSSPSGIDCGDDCEATFSENTTVTLTVEADSNSTFAGWSGACTGNNPICSVTVTADTTVTAMFVDETTPQHQLTVTKAGDGSGTVMSDPAGIDCGIACEAFFEQAAVVTLTATPNANSIFAGWDGACSGTDPICNVTMAADESVTATFIRQTTPQHRLTVNKIGDGIGTVMSDPAGIDCGVACEAFFEEGVTVALTATPTANSTFAEWDGACSGTSSTCTVIIDADTSVTAMFNPLGDAVTLTITGPSTPAQSGGEVAYVLTVNNPSSVDLTDVTLVTFPPNSTWRPASSASIGNGGVCGGGVTWCYPGNSITWELGTVGAGQSRSIPISYTVDSGVPDGTQLHSVASVSYEGGGTSAEHSCFTKLMNVLEWEKLWYGYLTISRFEHSSSLSESQNHTPMGGAVAVMEER
jgi:uncharacterized repeat protein (TIGR02543 family)